MATAAGSLSSMQCCPFQATAGLSLLDAAPTSKLRSFLSCRSQLTAPRLCLVHAAKPETLEKVTQIVKKQLALLSDVEVNGASKFAALGADSLDTVEIVMGLEEEFGVSVEEERAQTIQTIQDAADLIEKLVEEENANK